MASSNLATLSSGVVVGFVLLLSSLGKMFSLRWFARTVNSYRLLPVELVPYVALSVVFAELFLGLSLSTGLWRPWPAYGAVVLLCIFSWAIIVNVLRGRRDTECGCSGFWSRAKFGWRLVARNLGLIGLAVISTGIGWPSRPGLVIVVFWALATLILSTIFLDWSQGRRKAHASPARA